MMTRVLFILLLALSFATRSAAARVYDFNSTCRQAYADITSLKINSGQQLIANARLQNPDNLIPDLLQGYVDFFVLFFNEDPAEYSRRKSDLDSRIATLKDGNQSSPYYNYCLGVAYLQKAMVAIKFNERINAFFSFKKAFSYIKDNRKQHPSFLPNHMIYGPMQVVAGIIPDGYKGIAGWLGIKGSVTDGMALMRGFVNSSDSSARFFFNEAAFYYCYLLFYVENKPEQAFAFIRQKELDVVNNHLFAYMAANLAINSKRSDYSKQVILNRNKSSDYLDIPVWNYELAFVKMNHLELADATRYFEAFLKSFKGNFYVKDAYQKLSWCYYLQGNRTAADRARQLLLERGNTVAEADKQAYREAKEGTYPNALLLKARLLNDGGYNAEALKLMQGRKASDFRGEEEKLEFYYRTARIYDDMGNNEEALRFYSAAIAAGKNSRTYYAARAALQSGSIYEKTGDMQNAIQYYRLCLGMDDHDYKNSIDQKAKAGIARCEGQ